MNIIKQKNNITNINVNNNHSRNDREKENIDFNIKIKTPTISNNTVNNVNGQNQLPRCFTDFTEIQTDIDFEKLDEMLNDYASNFSDTEEKKCVMFEEGCDKKFENEREMYKHLVSECNYFICRLCSKRLKEEEKALSSDLKKLENNTTLIDTRDNIKYLKNKNNTPDSMTSINENKTNFGNKTEPFIINEDNKESSENILYKSFKKGINNNKLKIKNGLSNYIISKPSSFSLISIKNIFINYNHTKDEDHTNLLLKNKCEYAKNMFFNNSDSEQKIRNLNNSIKNFLRVNEEENLIHKPKFSSIAKRNLSNFGKSLILNVKSFKNNNKKQEINNVTYMTDNSVNSITNRNYDIENTFSKDKSNNKTESNNDDLFVKIVENENIQKEDNYNTLNKVETKYDVTTSTNNLFKLISSKINNNKLNTSMINKKNVSHAHNKSKSGFVDCLDELNYNAYKDKYHKPNNSAFSGNIKVLKGDNLNEINNKTHERNVSAFDQSVFKSYLNQPFKIFGAKCKCMKLNTYQFQNGKIESICVINEFSLGLVGIEDGSLNLISFENVSKSKNMYYKPFKVILIENIEISKIKLINEIPILQQNENDKSIQIYSYYLALSSSNYRGKIVVFRFDINYNQKSKILNDPSYHKYSLTKISEINQNKSIKFVDIIKNYSLEENCKYFNELNFKPKEDLNGIFSVEINDNKSQELFVKKNHLIIFTNNTGELIEASIFKDSTSLLVKDNSIFHKKIFYYANLKLLFFSSKDKAFNTYKIDINDETNLKIKLSINKKQLQHNSIIDNISVNHFFIIDKDHHIGALNDQNLFIFNSLTMTVVNIITLHSTFIKSKIFNAIYNRAKKQIIFGLTNNSLLFYNYDIQNANLSNEFSNLIEIEYEKHKSDIQELKIPPRFLKCYKNYKIIVLDKTHDILYSYYD